LHPPTVVVVVDDVLVAVVDDVVVELLVEVVEVVVGRLVVVEDEVEEVVDVVVVVGTVVDVDVVAPGTTTVAEAITSGCAMPVFSQASSIFAPSSPRWAFAPVFARYRNWTYSQLVG
jgi:hypothetical protein